MLLLHDTLPNVGTNVEVIQNYNGVGYYWLRWENKIHSLLQYQNTNKRLYLKNLKINRYDIPQPEWGQPMSAQMSQVEGIFCGFNKPELEARPDPAEDAVPRVVLATFNPNNRNHGLAALHAHMPNLERAAQRNSRIQNAGRIIKLLGWDKGKVVYAYDRHGDMVNVPNEIRLIHLYFSDNYFKIVVNET